MRLRQAQDEADQSLDKLGMRGIGPINADSLKAKLALEIGKALAQARSVARDAPGFHKSRLILSLSKDDPA